MPPPPPPPPDQRDHRGTKRDLQNGKFCWAIFGAQTFGSQTPPLPLLSSNTALPLPLPLPLPVSRALPPAPASIRLAAALPPPPPPPFQVQLSAEELRLRVYDHVRLHSPKAYIRLHTSVGEINMELFPHAAPMTCENFITHCSRGYYNNTLFHRSIKNFMIQGGDPRGDGIAGLWGFCEGVLRRWDCDGAMVLRPPKEVGVRREVLEWPYTTGGAPPPPREPPLPD